MSYRFLISLTTIPQKLHAIEEPIDSILRQDTYYDENNDLQDRKKNDVCIVVNIAKSYDFRLRGSQVDPNVLEGLRNKYKDERVYFHMCETDYGPGSKLVGLFPPLYDQYRVFNSSRGNDDPTNTKTVIVLIDDDVGYFPHMLKNIVRALKEGHRAGSHYCYSLETKGGCLSSVMTVAQGVDGFFMLAEDVFPSSDTCPNHNDSLSFPNYFQHILSSSSKEDLSKLLLHDDVYISYFFHKKGIPLHHIQDGYIYFFTRFQAHNIQALHLINTPNESRGDLNNWCPVFLDSIFR